MKLRYIGPHDAVEVPLPDGKVAGSWEVVERGGVLETSEQHGKQLLAQQGNWEPALPAAKSAAKPAKKE